MAGKELKVKISAEENASRAFKQVATAAAALSKALEQAGQEGEAGFERLEDGADKAAQGFLKVDEAGTGAVRSIGEASDAATRAADSFIQIGVGLQSATDAMGEWSQSARDQEQRLIGIRTAFGQYGDEMVRFSDQMASTTIFNDDDILAGERFFATLKNNYDLSIGQIQQLMQVTADLASASGVSFEDASSRVTAAIRGEGEAAEYLGLTMNQQSIDRNNLTLTMSNQEAAQFRLNALYQQAAAYEGSAQKVAQSSVGTYASVTNAVEDLTQSVGGVIGPYASMVASFGSGVATFGETIRGVNEVKTGLTGLKTLVQGSSLAMSALSLATGPVGVALLAITATVGAGLYLWQQHTKEVKEAEEAYAAYGKAVQTVDEAIANEKLNGNDALAARMENTAKAINDAAALGVSKAQEVIEQSKIDWRAVMDTKGAEETISAVTAYISDGMGKAAFDWAHETGRLTDEAFRNIFTNPAGNLGQIESIMNEYWAALTPSDEDAAKIQGEISKVFDLMANPKIDQARLTAGVQKIYADLARTGDVDAALSAFEALFSELEAGASSANNLHNALQQVTDFMGGEMTSAIDRTNQALLDGQKQAASTGDAYAELYRAQNGEYPAEDATRRHNDLLREQALLAGLLAAELAKGQYADKDKVAAYEGALESVNDELEEQNRLLAENAALRAQWGTQDILDSGFKGLDEANANRARQNAFWAEYVLGQAGEGSATAMERAADAASKASTAASAGAEAYIALNNAATNAATAIAAINEAQKQVIADWQQLTGNDDFMSQLNLAGLGTEYTQLAGGLNDANTAMSDGFRIVVQNTNAIAQNAQSVTDWATELINVEGTYGKIDDLLANGTITLSQYKDAQQAYNSIAADNASIQEDILTIQAKQAPVLAELMAGTQDYVETISTLPPMQQAVALGWMDANEATKANQILTMAAAAANGELGARGKEATTAMIQGAVAADPYLKAMLLDMGLISEGADGTITVNFDGAESVTATLDDINTSILTLADLLDDGEINGSIDIEVEGREQLEEAKRNLEALGGQTYTVTVDVAGKAMDALTKDLILTDGTVVTVPVDLDVQDWTVTPEEWAKAKDLRIAVQGQITEVSTAVGAGIEGDPVPIPATPVIQGPPDLSGVPPVQVPATLAFDLGVGAADAVTNAAGNALGGAQDITVTVTATADVSEAVIGLYNLQTQADTLSGTPIELVVNADLGTVQSDLDTLNSTQLDDKTLTLYGDATIALAAVDNVNSATLTDKTVMLYGDATIALGAIANVNNEGLADKTVMLYGDATIALGAIDNVNNAVLEDKTMTITVNTVYTTTGTKATRHGGIPAYSKGGVLFEAGEAGPELATFANGGTAILPTHGYYMAPPATVITPANATPAMAGRGPLVHIDQIVIGAGADPAMADVVADRVMLQLERAVEQRYRSAGVQA